MRIRLMLVFGWVVLGLVGATLLRSRGMKPSAAFAVGLLLGPFSLLVAVATPTSKKCPMCAELVKKDALVCKHCGHQFGRGPYVS
jgi:hypothetical protein